MYGLDASSPDGSIHPVTPAHHSAPARSEPVDTRVAFPSTPIVHPERPSSKNARTMRLTSAMASMALNELGPMLTASEVAELLHLHVNTVKRLGDRGELPFYRVCKRGDRRFRTEDVAAFLGRNR